MNNNLNKSNKTKKNKNSHINSKPKENHQHKSNKSKNNRNSLIDLRLNPNNNLKSNKNKKKHIKRSNSPNLNLQSNSLFIQIKNKISSMSLTKWSLKRWTNPWLVMMPLNKEDNIIKTKSESSKTNISIPKPSSNLNLLLTKLEWLIIHNLNLRFNNLKLNKKKNYTNILNMSNSTSRHKISQISKIWNLKNLMNQWWAINQKLKITNKMPKNSLNKNKKHPNLYHPAETSSTHMKTGNIQRDHIRDNGQSNNRYNRKNLLSIKRKKNMNKRFYRKEMNIWMSFRRWSLRKWTNRWWVTRLNPVNNLKCIIRSAKLMARISLALVAKDNTQKDRLSKIEIN